MLLSFAISIGLQSTSLSTELVNDVKNNLNMNYESIIPSKFVLTGDKSFMVLAFQPNCEYILT